MCIRDRLTPDEAEFLQDMLMAGINAAIEQSQALAAQRMEGITGGVGGMDGLLGGLMGSPVAQSVLPRSVQRLIDEFARLPGIGPEDLRAAELVTRVAAGGFREIILATNPTLEGESTALYLQRRLVDHKVRLTRLARGLPVGGDLEYTDEITLGRAFEGRQDV